MTTPTLLKALQDIVALKPNELVHNPFRAQHIAEEALAAQPESPEPLCAFRRKNQIDQEWKTCSRKQWAVFSQRPVHYELALFYTADQLQQAVKQAQAKQEPMSREEMYAIFIANGFTIKGGDTDLKPYVYAAGRAIEAHHNIGAEK